jgi:hypothetical protein
MAMDIQKYVDELTEKALSPRGLSAPIDADQIAAVAPLEVVLPGLAVELWSDRAGRLFLVADEADARRVMAGFGAPRGEVYTAAEARRIVAVSDPAAVAEIQEWKRQFDATLTNHQPCKQMPE